MGTLRDVLGISDRRRARDAISTAQLGNFDLNLSGSGASFSPEGASINMGSLDPVRLQFLQAISQNVNGGQLPAGVINAARGADSALTGPVNLGATGVDPGFIAALQSAAGGRLATAGQSADAMAADRLALLREQAAPHEQRAIQATVQDLFNRGRFGPNDSVSNDTAQAISRGLGEADLARQIEAQNLGLTTQAQAVQQALGLSGQADALLGNQFQRSLTGATYNDSRAVQRFGVAQELFNTQQGGQNQALQRAITSLSGVQGIDNQGLQQFIAALQGAVARSNAALGQASNLTQLGASSPLLDLAGGLGAAWLGRPA